MYVHIYLYLYKMCCAHNNSQNTSNFKAQGKIVESKIGSKNNAIYMKGMIASE